MFFIPIDKQTIPSGIEWDKNVTGRQGNCFPTISTPTFKRGLLMDTTVSKTEGQFMESQLSIFVCEAKLLRW